MKFNKAKHLWLNVWDEQPGWLIIGCAAVGFGIGIGAMMLAQ